jgi:hypothetical protein
MRRHATIDLETDPFLKGRLPVAFAGCFFDGKISSIFWGGDCCQKTVDAAIEFSMKCEGLLVFAHNGGKFDFHFLLAAILKRFSADDLEIMAIGSRIVKIKCPTLEFRDSYALIPKPLKSFGNKKEIDITKLESVCREQNKEEICAYLKQDCIGLYEGLNDFFGRYGCEITLASCTFKVLKKNFGVKPIKTGEDYDTLFRDFYFAGRVQFFSLGKHGDLDGKKRFSICDINSAFPWAMLSQHWFGRDYVRTDRPPKEGKETCFYEVVCDSQGALPMREKSGGVCFPVVKQARFFATGWELFTGIELGLVSNVKICVCYVPQVLQDFSAYVQHFYEMKRTAENPSDRDFAKLFLNSLYGKFALNPREFRDVKITPWGEVPAPRLVETAKKKIKAVAWEHSFDDLGRGLSFWQTPSRDVEDGKPLSFYNVCTAASITGKVRAFLQRSMHACGGVLYCDTDSVIAEDVSALEMSHDKLGAWKLEKECDAVFLGGKKLYAAHSFKLDDKKPWKTASKGVRLSVPDLIAVCEGEARSYSFDAPNYSVFSRPSFTTRTVRRDDKRNKNTNKK